MSAYTYQDDEIDRLAAIARDRRPVTHALVGRGPGRPSSYEDDIANVICDMIADGHSLRTICQADEMPHRLTVLRWLDKHEDFATKYARAREMQADVMDDRIMEVADACTAETAAADRVKIGAYQWRAGRLAPKRYGDKVMQDHDVRLHIESVTRRIIGD